MRHMKSVLGVATLVCAFALSASSSVAAEFAASRMPTPISEASPGLTTGRSLGAEFSQVFKFAEFTIKCNKATAYAKTVGEGAVTWSTSLTFATEIKFQKCLTVAKFGSFTGGIPTKFNEGNPIKVLFHINGFTEFGSGPTETEVEISSGAASFKIGSKICNISWPSQTVPTKAEKEPEGEFSSAVYSNKEVEVGPTMYKKFPSHFQKRLVIANEWAKMTYEYEEGQCLGEGGFEEEANKIEGKDGKYTGTLEEEIKGGNLSFIP